jgi:integrase
MSLKVNGPGAAHTARGPDTGELTPMPTTSSHGAASRRPVFSGSRRVPGLYERSLADGSTVYEVAFWQGGKTHRHRLQAATKTDAIAELGSLRTDYARGEAFRSPSAALTVSELAADWLEQLTARIEHRDPSKRRSPRTVALYRQRLEQHILPEWENRPAAEVTLRDVRRLADRLGSSGLSPSTVSGILNITSGLFRFGMKQGALERNPVRDLDRDDRPGSARLTEPRYLDAAELERLLGKLSDTFRPVAACCAYAGLRVSEALGLRWQDVDFKAGTLTVAGQLGPDGSHRPAKSTASAATVPLLPMLARKLQAHRIRQAKRSMRRVHRDALVFQTMRGKPQSRRNALRAVHAAGDAVGLNGDGREKVGLHDLRHSLAAIALASGLSLPETAALVRHANPQVTATVYAGLTDHDRERLGAKLTEAGFGR